MVAAYAYADAGDQISDELVLARTVEKYGAQAIFGRALSFQEVRSMSLADNIVKAYGERNKSDNWAEWSASNPSKARLLNTAGKLYDEQDSE
jgi:hypothetical protein